MKNWLTKLKAKLKIDHTKNTVEVYHATFTENSLSITCNVCKKSYTYAGLYYKLNTKGEAEPNWAGTAILERFTNEHRDCFESAKS